MSVLYLGDTHGRFSFGSTGFKHHLRPIDNYSGAINVVWSRMLDNVGAGMGQGSDTSNLRGVQLSCDTDKGKETT